MLMSFVWNSLGLPWRARRLLRLGSWNRTRIRYGSDGSARMLMSFVWNSLDLPCHEAPASGDGCSHVQQTL